MLFDPRELFVSRAEGWSGFLREYFLIFQDKLTLEKRPNMLMSNERRSCHLTPGHTAWGERVPSMVSGSGGCGMWPGIGKHVAQVSESDSEGVCSLGSTSIQPKRANPSTVERGLRLGENGDTDMAATVA
jgi:hypothetical protein